MKAPLLLAALDREALEKDESLTRTIIDELRASGKLKDGDQLTWNWVTREGGQTVGQLWRGSAPPMPGAIVQSSKDHHWPGCLFVITEAPKNWGVIAELRMPDGEAPIRLAWEEIEIVGFVKDEIWAS